MIPEGLRYTKEHEWIRTHGTGGVIGITHFAQEALGDVVYVELPAVGAQVRSGEEIGEVESTKATSPIYSPVTGAIVTVNEALKTQPELVNHDPYGKGWVAEIQVDDPQEIETLMDAAAYERFFRGEGG